MKRVYLNGVLMTEDRNFRPQDYRASDDTGQFVEGIEIPPGHELLRPVAHKGPWLVRVDLKTRSPLQLARQERGQIRRKSLARSAAHYSTPEYCAKWNIPHIKV